MNNELKKLSPFKNFCITIGNLPTAYIESMSYYEGLTFLVNYLANNVIPVVNNNSEVTKEIQSKFAELQSFVENYFENLDVQEEVNNKLDEMVDDGTLLSLLDNYANITKVFERVSDMLADETLIDGSKVRTLGYNSIDDGICDFIITDTSDSSHYQLTLSNGLYATMLNRKINIKYLGVDTNDDITAVCNSNLQYFDEVIIDDNYTMTNHIIISNPIRLICTGGSITSTEATTCYISLLDESYIKDLEGSNIGIDVYGSNNVIENCKLSNNVNTSFYINCGNSVDHVNNKFINCESYKSKAFGYQIGRNTTVTDRSESISGANIDNLIYENCKAIYNGQDEGTVYGTWSTGFCIENAGANNGRIVYINCEAAYSSESGFHCEYNTIPKNLTYINCYSHDNGNLKPSPTYGAGYLVPQIARCINCKSINNYMLYYASEQTLTKPLYDFENLDIIDDSNTPDIRRLRDLFARPKATLNWDGTNIVTSSSSLTNISATPKLRPEFWFNKRNDTRFSGYITITGNQIDLAESDGTKWPVDLNVIPVSPYMQLNFSFDAKAKVHTEGLNNNCYVFFMGYDENFTAIGNVKSKSLNGIDTDDFITITESNIDITNKNIVYVVPVIMPNYSNVYTYQAPIIKNIKVWQS